MTLVGRAVPQLTWAEYWPSTLGSLESPPWKLQKLPSIPSRKLLKLAPCTRSPTWKSVAVWGKIMAMANSRSRADSPLKLKLWFCVWTTPLSSSRMTGPLPCSSDWNCEKYRFRSDWRMACGVYSTMPSVLLEDESEPGGVLYCVCWL